ncbi:HNH endonuclease [Clostridium botulinum]|nr:HNH endonuclease [Clostridium botulinum]NFP00345.1 HNH endonuclease [Clostridium botulinum]
MSISSKVQKLLYFSSGGFCQNPSCNNELYKLFETGEVGSIEEMAHVIGRSQNGPRGDSDVALPKRDEFENIILLCPSCHRTIDKNPNEFPVEVLLEWKKNHIDKIKSCFIEPIYKTRKELRRALDRLLIENNVVFEQYGPYSEEYTKILTNVYETWRRKAIETIVPNNKKIVKLLDVNDELINDDELVVVEKFKEHAREFEYNQLSNEPNSHAPLFPKEIYDILRG